MTGWPYGIPGLVRVTDGPVRGREYDPEAERYVCCGSRQCWWCERGTVRVKADAHNQVLVSVLKEKMLNPAWWSPSITGAFLGHELRQCAKAFAALEEKGQERVPLKLTGERFDTTDGDRIGQLAGLPFTDADMEELLLLSILHRQQRRR